MDEYIENLKTTIALEIIEEEKVLNSMRSYLGKLVLNHTYGKENMPESEIGIKNKEQEIKKLIEFYEGIPRYTSLRDVFMGICKEGKIFNKQEVMKYVEEHLSGFEKIEAGDRLGLSGQCTTKIKPDKVKEYGDMKIPADGYCIYYLIVHTGEYKINSSLTIREVEKEILSETGVKDVLISEMIVLYNGQVKRYDIVNKKGTELTKGQIEKMNTKTVKKLQIIWDIVE